MYRKDVSRNELSVTLLFFGLTLVLAFCASYLCINDPFFKAMVSLARQSELLASRYFGEVAPERIFSDAWRGMQSAIPFKVRLSDLPGERQSDRSRQDWGLTLAPLDSGIQVMDVAANSPFHGLLSPEDKITGVDELRDEEFATLIDYLNNKTTGETRVFFERKGMVDSVTVQINAADAASDLVVDSIGQITYLAMRSPSQENVLDVLRRISTTHPYGMILDLRESSGDEIDHIAPIAEEIARIADSVPIAILVDQSTRGASEILARKLVLDKQITAIGEPTRGASVAIEEIQLRSGQKLYVSTDESTLENPVPADSTTDSLESKISVNAIVPEIECTQEPMTPLTFELIHRDYFLNFVTVSSYTNVPPVEDEDLLFANFENYLRHRGFRYDPIGESLSDLSIYQLDSEMQTIYNNMRIAHGSIGEVDLRDYRDEIIRSLLKTIHRVKVGGDYPLDLRMRTDDPCLARAIEYLEGKH